MNIDQKNKIIIISSPSGAGKTTLCKLLLKKMRNINLSISYTSRNQRLNEKNGRDYLSGFNLLTFTNYSGYDPESRTDAGGIGQVFYSAPAARTISIGLNLGF